MLVSKVPQVIAALNVHHVLHVCPCCCIHSCSTVGHLSHLGTSLRNSVAVKLGLLRSSHSRAAIYTSSSWNLPRWDKLIRAIADNAEQ